jgi:hypothetical protein
VTGALPVISGQRLVKLSNVTDGKSLASEEATFD